MKLRQTLYLFLISMSASALAAEAPARSVQIRFESVETKSFLSTALIAHRNGDTLLGEGTGILVQVPRKLGSPLIMLCSAAHVLGEPQNPIYAVFHGVNPNPGNFEITTATFREVPKTPEHYFIDSSPDVDLACSDITSIAGQIFFQSFMISDFASLQEPALVPNADLFFIGYPDGRIDKRNFMPLSRRGSLASIPQLDYDGRPMFVIDAQAFPGSSGSPVIWKTTKGFKVLGLLTETMTKTIPLPAGQPGAAQSPQTLTTMLGLGLVRKSTQVAQFLSAAADHFEKSEKRADPAQRP